MDEEFINDFVDGMQGGFNSSHKRKKVMRKLEALLDTGLVLSETQVYVLLLGRVEKKGPKMGLIEVTGTIKKKEVCIMALRIVRKMVLLQVNGEKIFASLPEEKYNLMSLDHHINAGPPTQTDAFLLVRVIMMTRGPALELDTILHDDNAHDSYIEWESITPPPQLPNRKQEAVPVEDTNVPTVSVPTSPTTPARNSLPTPSSAHRSSLSSFFLERNVVKPLKRASAVSGTESVSDPLGITEEDMRALDEGMFTEEADPLIAPVKTTNVQLDDVRESQVLEDICRTAPQRYCAGSLVIKANEPPSILTSSPNFDPSLFLFKVHRDTQLREIMNGIENLERSNEDRMQGLKQLVLENFDEFVQSRDTINHIYSLITPEITNTTASPAPTRSPALRKELHKQRPPKEPTSLSQKVMESLDSAFQTVEVEFVPMLENRKRIRKLRRAKETLAKLEYLWILPQQVRSLIKSENWVEAVIEFVKVSNHLRATDDVSNRVFEDALNDLEQCGRELIEALMEYLTRDSNDDDLPVTSSSSLRRIDALTLLLELRDNIPEETRLFSYLDADNDPFIRLSQFLESTAVSRLEKVRTSEKFRAERTILDNASKIAATMATAWYDSRSCIDATWNQNNREMFVAAFHTGTKRNNDRAKTQISGSRERRGTVIGLSRGSASDKLFDIRKRLMSQSDLELLKSRRDASDQMVYRMLCSYAEIIVESVSLCTTQKQLMDTLLAALEVTGRFVRLDVLRAANFAEARILDELGEDDPEAERVIERGVCVTLGTQIRDFLSKRVDALKLTEKRSVNQDAENIHTAALLEMCTVIDALVDDTARFVGFEEATLVLEDDFVQALGNDLVARIFDHIRLVPNWLSASLPFVQLNDAPNLFADSNYLRSVYIVNLESKLQSVFSSVEFPPLKDIQAAFEACEISVMTQYVVQKAQGLEVFVAKAILFGSTLETWPLEPSFIRPYTLDIISHLVNVVAECGHRLAQKGTKLLLNGLTRRLSECFERVLQQSTNLNDIQRNIGAVRQLDLEILFLKHVLREYETSEGSKRLHHAREILANGTVSDHVSPEYWVLIEDLETRSSLLVSSLQAS